jgi:hypothetical protein
MAKLQKETKKAADLKKNRKKRQKKLKLKKNL